MAPPLPPKSGSDSPPFDPQEFSKYMKKYGRAYRHRSIELIRLCRFFPRTFHDFSGRYYDLLR